MTPLWTFVQRVGAMIVRKSKACSSALQEMMDGITMPEKKFEAAEDTVTATDAEQLAEELLRNMPVTVVDGML